MKVETKPQANGSRLGVIFLTVFIDLIGFGIVIPLSPYLAREFHATPFEVGLLMSVYSIMQFIFSPFWGGLSDRIGRRPVILISLLGGCASYVLFACSQSLTLLFVARGLAGAFGGNISTAHAYIADITKPEERSKGMGLLGAAFGLGFIFGPVIGAELGRLGQTFGSAPPLGQSFAALGAAALCLVNFTFALFVLKESLSPELRNSPRERKNRFIELFNHLRRPVAGPLMIVFFLSGLAMAQMEVMLFPFVADVFKWDYRTSSYGFAYIGVLMVITQGALVRRLMPKYGERRVLAAGLAMFAISLAMIPFSTTISLLGLAMTILALGNGLMRPPNLGLISLATPVEIQGSVMGVTNSLSSLGRILGPVVGGLLYERVNRGAPFILSSLLAALALYLARTETRRISTES